MRHEIAGRARALVHAIREGDQAEIEEAVLRVSRSRRWLAPLALTISTVVLLLEGLRLIFSNWRLTLLQVLPAVWVWLAFFDLKVHALHGRSFNLITGWHAWVAAAIVVALTAVVFYVNAIGAFAITASGGPSIPEGRANARLHRRTVVCVGAVIGVGLAWSSIFAPRYGPPWFALSMGIVVGVMMIAYVSVPTRLLAVTPAKQTPREKVVALAVTGALSGMATAPAYVLSRIGILMLGSHVLFIPGILLTAVGFALEAGAQSAVRAIKMSMKLLAGDTRDAFADQAAAADGPAAGDTPAADPSDGDVPSSQTAGSAG